VRFVDIQVTDTGNLINPLIYLDQLTDLAPQLPPGARTFATDPDHYDFVGERCVKDLRIQTLRFGSDDDGATFEVHFRHNCWKHEEDLRITYRGLSSLRMDNDPQDKWGGQVVILDEILPHEHGCSHEIECHTGTLTVVAEDLEAVWVPADCAEQEREHEREHEREQGQTGE
jgi:hypothetical protein